VKPDIGSESRFLPTPPTFDCYSSRKLNSNLTLTLTLTITHPESNANPIHDPNTRRSATNANFVHCMVDYYAATVLPVTVLN